MKSKALAVLTVTAGLLIGSIPILAHHGTNISYDRTKEFTVTATVTEFRYSSPHPQLYLEITDEEGKVTNWSSEIAANFPALILRGWTRARSTEALKPGTEVTVTLAPSRAGTTSGLVRRIVGEDGEEILGAN